MIYRYRNCPAPCLNTLAYTVKDRRDQSKAGDERRMQFKGLKGTMKDRFVLRDKASHDMTLFLMRAILSGATEEEAYQALKKDIRTLKFTGYATEPPMRLETLSSLT